jgi:hypothetical protein
MLEIKDNNKKSIKLTEEELKQVVKEASMNVIKEWGFPDVGFGDDYETPYGDLDDPRDVYADEKEGDIDYSWDEDAYMNDETPRRMKNHHDEMDKMASMRDKDAYWRNGELRNRDRMMDKWINGKADPEDIGDEWDDIHYESKEPIRVTESELKTIVKEAAIKLIKEYGDTPKGAYNVGKLAARQTFRDGDRHKGARTWCSSHSEFDDDRKSKQLYKAQSKGYEDGKKEFQNEEIEIKPENKGKFNATKKATGKSTEELKHSKNPLTRKRATFAQNAKKWAKK